MKAYYTNWDDSEGDDNILTTDNRISQDANPQNETDISPSDAKRIIQWVGKHKDSGYDIFCWAPHHAFVIYDKDGAILHAIDVCFICRQYRATVGQKRIVADLTIFKEVLENNGFKIRNSSWRAPDHKDAQPQAENP